jgi:DNA primase catalytic core
MYTENSIDEVRNASILQVVGNYLELKQSGSKYFAKSPFSEDRTASFCVTPALNIFKCFSSGLGGDAIKFVMLHKGATFFEAVKTIADICKITLQEVEVTEEEQRRRNYKQELLDLISAAATKYQRELHKLPADHWVARMRTARGIDDDTLASFLIGYAPDDFKFLTTPLIEKGLFEQAKSSGLVVSKDGKSFDFFRDRFMFPIVDHRGHVVGFGGRRNDGIEGPKYMNTPQTEIYDKSKVLYGLFQGREAIAKDKTAILVEGYTDVTALHQHGCQNAVANCGTAQLSSHQCALLRRYCHHIIICRDNDGPSASGDLQKGNQAAFKDINVLLAEGFKVSIVVLPEGEDPDSFSRKTEDIKAWIYEHLQDGVMWKATHLKNTAANDPHAVSDMVEQLAETLYAIKDDVARATYMDQVRKLVKQPVKVFKDRIEILQRTAEIKAEKESKVPANLANDLGLPEGADIQEFLAHKYVTVGNAIYFRGKEQFFKASNFKITPLFHIAGMTENKRLVEVINEFGIKALVDFEVEDLIQKSRFETRLLKEPSPYYFYENFNGMHFNILRNRFLNDFTVAYPLKTLGWQPEGFFAFANMMWFKGNLKEVNKYGIVNLEVEHEETEYRKNVTHYYSPAFSEIYKHLRDDDDPYENDRYLVYKKAPCTLNEWMTQMVKVYENKAMKGIAFLVATMVRDIFIKRYQFFPHLFLAGEKGSGKSKFGESLVAVFLYKQEPFDLNSGTPVAFYRRLARIVNAPTMLEEYHDNIDDNKFQPLKGAYDGRGREMGKATGDNRTTTTRVNCSCIILSQYLSSRDDNSLTTRSIIEHFIKPQESYTTQQIEDYARLKAWEEFGLSSLVCDLMSYRSKLEESLHKTYAELSRQLKNDLKGKDYQERMLQNYLALLVPMKIIFNDIKPPFTWEDFYGHCREAIIDSSDLIVESEGLAEFWKTLEYLRDRKPYALLEEGLHFQIDTPISLRLQRRKGEADEEWNNPNRNRVLMLRLNAVHQLYHKEVSTREGVEVIGENTLRNYFKSKKYFIGSVKSHRFKDTSTSAYCFNYDMMEVGGILNLVRHSEVEAPEPRDKQPGDGTDGLPF